jgi:hypothetical protein
MTHILREEHQLTLHAFLDPSDRFSPSQLSVNPGLVPRMGGLYGWWFLSYPPRVQVGGALKRGDLALLYVGIAPQRPAAHGQASRRTLRDRLRNHCRGPIATSTFRRSLASLLADELGFQITRGPTGKVEIGRAAEERLTQWIEQHARVSWVVHREPWLLEEALIADGPRLPLNIRGSTDPFSLELQRLRAV